MIRDRLGKPVATNAPIRDTDCIEVVMAYPEFITAFERWLSDRGMYLFPIPLAPTDDSLPAYGIGFVTTTQPTAALAESRGHHEESADE